jgi:hypothetical protein
MKKHLIFVLLVNIVSSLINTTDAQTITKYVKDNYSPNIVVQVFDIINKTDISDENQKTIADLMTERDSIMYEGIRNSQSYTEINDVKIDYEDQINAELNIEQKYYKYVKTSNEKAKDKYSYSQFAIAVRYRDTLNLSQAQTISIFQYIDTLKQMKNQHYIVSVVTVLPGHKDKVINELFDIFPN